MSQFKKPGKPQSHSNSKKARRDLEKWLPDEWNLASNVDDDDSGYEWGEDWIVEIVDSGECTGAKFSIQSKVFKGEDAINANGIGTEINISTINRLFDIVYPVLIHFVHPKTNQSYVVWLDDWMGQQTDLSWREKSDGTITLRIPAVAGNQLNKGKIEQIKQDVLMHSFQHGNYKVVDLINKTSEDYRIDLIQTGKDTTLIIHALNDEAIPEVSLLDEEAFQSFQQILDTGLPGLISGKIAFSNIPPLLMQKMQGLELTHVVAGRTDIETKTLVFSIELLNEDRQTLYKVDQINMKKVQPGRKIVKWQGSSVVDGVALSLSVAPKEPEKFKLGFSVLGEINTPLVALNRLRFIQAMQKATSVSIQEMTLGVPFGESPMENLRLNVPEPIPDTEIQLAEALVAISRHLRLSIEFPEQYRLQDVAVARMVHQILLCGRVNGLADFFPPENGKGIAKALIYPEALSNFIAQFDKSVETGEENLFIMPADEPVFKLLGHDIHLGRRRMVILDFTSISQSDEKTVIDESVPDAVEVDLEFNLSDAYTIYENWCSDEDKARFFSD